MLYINIDSLSKVFLQAFEILQNDLPYFVLEVKSLRSVKTINIIKK